MKKTSLLPLLIAVLLLGGCNLPAFVNIPTPGPAAAPTVEASATPEPPATPTAEASPTAEATPTATTAPADPAEPSACVAPGAATLPGGMPDFDRLPALFAEYLSAGGGVGQLRDTLEQWGAIRETEVGQFGLVDAEHDFDGDGVNDVLIAAVDASTTPVTAEPPGALFVFTCADGGYELAYTDADTDAMQATSVPQILALHDITGDGLADILFERTACGAHTCYQNIQGLYWDTTGPGAGPELMLAEPVSEPYAEIEVPEPEDGEPAQVVVNVGMIGSVGAGPQRTWRDVYAWDGETLARVEHEATSPAHPIHLVNEADDLFLAGNYAGAISLFRRSYEDPTLDREWGMYEGWEQDLEAYARYRIMLAHVLLGDEQQAAAFYDAMQVDFPDPDEPGGLFAQWADLFRAEYQASGGVIAACSAVLETIDPDSPDLPLNMFGYANRFYEPAEMCPFEGSSA